MTSKNVSKNLKKLSDKDKKIARFSDILDSLDSLEDKKKLLWKEIYENSLEDRINAKILFDDLMMQSTNNPGNHAMFGSTMSKYLERMSKSNDQILKLVELISKEEEKNVITDNEIFNQIEG